MTDHAITKSYLSSARNSSQSSKTSIRILTMVLFAIGGIIAAIAVYQQFTIAQKPYAISRQEAIAIALADMDTVSNRDATILPRESSKATLIHIGDDGWAFLADENTLDDTRAFGRDERFRGLEGERVWFVEITASNVNGGSRGFWYLIDIDSGAAFGKGAEPD